MAVFLCEDSEKGPENGVLSTKQQSLQKNRTISLQGLSYNVDLQAKCIIDEEIRIPYFVFMLASGFVLVC